MTDITQMVEQHILAYESRQKHMEELLARARAHVGEGAEHAEARAHLERITQEHSRLSEGLDALKRRGPTDWREEEIEQAGPMGIWDALAEQLETLVEKLTKH
jgi:predicted nuclease with TOPRIM domain